MIKVPELKNSPTDLMNLNKFLTRTVGKEFSSMVNSCYYPKMVQYWNDVKFNLGITEIEIKEFLKDLIFEANREKVNKSNFMIINDKTTGALLCGIIYYSRMKKTEISKLLYYLFAIKFYSNVINQFFEHYCKQDVWESALSKMSQKHLFKVRKGISNSIFYLADVEFAKWYKILGEKELSVEDLIKSAYALRHRINQSMKSFAQKYYEIDGNKKINITNTTGTESTSNATTISEKLSTNICTYNQIDKKAILQAMKACNIRKDVAETIVSNISDIEHRNTLYFIYILLSKSLIITEWCMDNKRNQLLKKILQDTARVSNYSLKQQFISLFDALEDAYVLKTININIIISFMYHYLMFYYKNRYC